MPLPIKPEVTIVIASHRERLIGACIEGFIKKSLGPLPAPVEIIVVADYPIEPIPVAHPAVQWIHCPDKNIPKKRNHGIAMASGSIIGFIDDDCESMDGWVSHAIRYLKNNPDHAGVAGNTTVERTKEISYPLTEFKRLEIPSFRTNNIFYRREAIKKVGGFDERFSFQREDVDLAFSILETGQIIGYCADIKVVHRCRKNERWDLLKNCVNRRFDPLLYKKHSLLYRKWIKTPFTPSITLVGTLFCSAAVAFIFGGKSTLFAASLVPLFALSMGIKRNRLGKFSAAQIIRDWISYMAAPFALIAALAYGSIKYRKILLY
jgi:glycosyltransferase involved in cell wall biosynthesis